MQEGPRPILLSVASRADSIQETGASESALELLGALRAAGIPVSPENR